VGDRYLYGWFADGVVRMVRVRYEARKGGRGESRKIETSRLLDSEMVVVSEEGLIRFDEIQVYTDPHQAFIFRHLPRYLSH